jgi:hypothetical protein
MPHLKISKNMLLGQNIWKKIKIKNKIVTHMDLWKFKPFKSP